MGIYWRVLNAERLTILSDRSGFSIENRLETGEGGAVAFQEEGGKLE